MKRYGHTDSVENLLAAKRRDLAPLIERSAAVLKLEGAKAQVAEDLLSRAWNVGGKIGGAHALSELGGPPVEAPDLEVELKPLLETAGEALELGVLGMVAASTFLSQAVIGGAKAGQAETLALAIERSHDLSGEAMEWLGRRDVSPEEDSPEPG
jgi:hypothetical protein